MSELAYLPDSAELVLEPLWHHERGLQQTASGYGRKLSTPYVTYFGGRRRRVYCCCYSNLGTCYVIERGRWLIVTDSHPRTN